MAEKLRMTSHLPEMTDPTPETVADMGEREATRQLRIAMGGAALTEGAPAQTTFEALARTPEAEEVNELRNAPGRSSSTYTMPEGSDPPTFNL